MNQTQLNINNLTALWKVAGLSTNSYFEEEGICWSYTKNSQWPNRIWTSKDVNQPLIERIKSRMSKNPSITFSHFNTDNEDRLISDNEFNLKSVQYGMNLKLASKFEIQRQLTFKKVQTRSDAELWSKAFEQSFSYLIKKETIINTCQSIPYFLVFNKNKLVGTVILYPTGNVAGIHSLGIVPGMRQQGFATEIMHHVLNRAIDSGAGTATLQASEMAKNLYLKMGFSIDFIMQNYQLNN